MMTLMQSQLEHLHSLNNKIFQALTTDLPQLHRAYDWLHVAPRVSLVADKGRVNFLAHDYHMQQYLRLMSGYMQLNDDFVARAIDAPSFFKHHKSHSSLCYRLVTIKSGS
jgi:hypothetical protein